MSDTRANIKVSREWYEEHNPKRKRLGVTWEEYAAGNAPNTGLADDLRDQLDRIESAAKEATNAAQNAERAAEELQR